MLTYFRGGYNDYTIRVEPIPSGSTHLGLTLQDMTTQENYGLYMSPGQWSYSEYESFVSFSVDLDTTTQGESLTGNELRMTLYPAYFPSGSETLLNLAEVWHGSIAFFEGQTEKKTEYVNQIPIPESGVPPYKSETSNNTFIILQ
jgi:hypothetical protein